MDKTKARKMYELADRLSKVDTSKLNEQQLVEHTGMIKRLGEELKAMRGVAEAADNVDERATENTAYRFVDMLANTDVGRAARNLTHQGKLGKRQNNYVTITPQGTAQFSIPFQVMGSDDQAVANSKNYKSLNNLFMQLMWPKRQKEGWFVSQPRTTQHGGADEQGFTIHTFDFTMYKPAGGQGVAEARDTGNDIDDIVEDYLDYLEQHGGFDYPTREEEKASIMADIESGALHPDELEYAMSGNNDMNEAPEEDLHTSYNVVKLGGALNIDPRGLRMAIARGMQGNPTRTDMMTLSNAFLNLLKNSDDAAIQKFANLIKSGNPRAVPQESTAAVAEANAFVDAMRQVKKGEKFTVGGKEHTKTTNFGEGKVEEAISTEAYDRLKRVFDFSNFKG